MNNKYDNLCDLVDKVKLNDPIGKGKYGNIFNFKIKNDETEYALKVISMYIEHLDYNEYKQKEFSYIAKNGKYYTYKNCYYEGKNEVSYTEYFISRLASNSGSDNFLHANSLGLYKCNSGNDETYILMEKVDGTLETLYKEISEEDMISIILQIMHAIYLMHELKINHNDLHPGNIFLKENKEIGKIMTLKVGEDLFSISIGKYIAKIGDWGLANCFDENNPFLNHHIGDNFFPIPDYFCFSYDIFLFIIFMEKRLSYSSFFSHILKWIVGDKQSCLIKADSFCYRECHKSKRYLNINVKNCDKEFPHVTAINFFKLEIMNKYKNY